MRNLDYLSHFSDDNREVFSILFLAGPRLPILPPLMEFRKTLWALKLIPVPCSAFANRTGEGHFKDIAEKRWGFGVGRSSTSHLWGRDVSMATDVTF